MPDVTTAMERDLQQVSKEQRAGGCTIVIFGGSGDLAQRKIIPALFNLVRQGLIPGEIAVVGAGIPVMTDEEYQKLVSDALQKFVGVGDADKEMLDTFISRSEYVSGDFSDDAFYQALKEKLAKIDAETIETENILFYLSTPPPVFPLIITKLGEHEMSKVSGHHHWVRIIIEKPFGKDLESARELNQIIGKVFQEWQVYRIDHYLGKETVQNILSFRFGNGIFEPLWNRNFIDHVQITASETLGVEMRGGYYDKSGALRDMLQNHLMQILSLIAMESPVTLDANAVRDEKVKVMRAIHPLSEEQVPDDIVRGQYGDGAVEKSVVEAYRKEPNVDPDSTTETFVAAKFLIDNWRWSGVPFYMRTGKRLQKKITDITIFFKPTPHLIFGKIIGSDKPAYNVMSLQLQPDEAITIGFQVKYPGMEMKLKHVEMDFEYKNAFKEKISEAYERLILDCLKGDATLFMRKDAIEIGWWLVKPILDYWKNNQADTIPQYTAGSWGPSEADKLLFKDSQEWRTL